MENGIRCPNPACEHLFPSAALVPSAPLTCPRCGKVFMPVIAQRSAPPVNPGATAAPAAAAALFTAGRRRRRRWNWGKILASAIFFGGGAAVLVWAWLGIRVDSDVSGPTGQMLEFPRFNCRYALPDSPWEAEQSGIKLSLKTAVVVMRRTSPDAWFALLVKEYKDRIPTDKEVRDEAVSRLGGYFKKENLEWERAGEGQLAGRPAQRLVFRGEVENQAMSGEGYYLLNQGLAYYFITWAPTEAIDKAQKEFSELRKRLALIGDRRDWTGKPATHTFHGRQAGYCLQDVDPLWQEWMPATDFDPRADLVLFGQEPTESEESEVSRMRLAASVVVLVLEESHENLAAAVKAAQARLEDQQKALYPETALSPAEGTAPQPSGQIGTVPGQIVTLRVKNAEKRHRFFLLGVIQQPGLMLVIQCECAWEVRKAWQPRFEGLLGAFRSEKGPKPAGKNHGGEAGGPG
jgi:hypothetical protein